MKVRIDRDGSLALRDLAPVVRLALERLPAHVGVKVEGDCDPARARLAPDPGGDDPFRKTWREVVLPELDAWFHEALETVGRQLGDSLAKENGVVIRPERREMWMHLLNRARLAIAARRGFTEEELTRPAPDRIDNERDFERVEMEIYAAILGLLVEVDSSQHFGETTSGG